MQKNVFIDTKFCKKNVELYKILDGRKKMGKICNVLRREATPLSYFQIRSGSQRSPSGKACSGGRDRERQGNVSQAERERG